MTNKQHKKQNQHKPVRGEAKNYDHLLTACTRDARVPAAAKGLFAYMVQNRHAILTGAVSEDIMRHELFMSDDERSASIACLENFGYLPKSGE